MLLLEYDVGGVIKVDDTQWPVYRPVICMMIETARASKWDSVVKATAIVSYSLCHTPYSQPTAKGGLSYADEYKALLTWFDNNHWNIYLH